MSQPPLAVTSPSDPAAQAAAVPAGGHASDRSSDPAAAVPSGLFVAQTSGLQADPVSGGTGKPAGPSAVPPVAGVLPAGRYDRHSYRPAIDGLRAIAVAAVVLYHFGISGMSGGFVGVDVFFVLSGFLIGGHLYTELRTTGRIALGQFWLRRIRRLAPAFMVMAAVTAVAAWAIMLPADLRSFGRSLITATTWLSNVQFWREAGYFDTGSALKPLLHTWSLSVEEQFYIVIPVFFLLFARIKGLGAALVAGWGLSLAACLWLTPQSPSAAFFLFPMRAWEMLTGVLLAIYLASGTDRHRPDRDGAERYGPDRHGSDRHVSDLGRPDRLAPDLRIPDIGGQGPDGHDRQGPPWAGALGLGLIALSLFTAQAGAHFPGWQAILPVAGTALVLWARDRGPVAAVLSHPVPVALGLVSYSLYLWHWPVVVLSRYWRGAWSGPLEAVLWCLLALALSIAAWALVERPLRRARLSGRVMVGGFVAGVMVLVGVGLWFWRTDGLPNRFGPLARAHIAASQDFIQDWSRCTIPPSGLFAGVEICPIGPDAPIDSIRTVYWGDSHLRALMDGLAAVAETPALIIWHAGCPPFVGVGKTESAASPAQDAACGVATAQTVQSLGDLAPDNLILVGRWRYYADGQGIGRDAHNLISLNGSDYVSAWDATITALGPLVGQITVLRQVPELPRYDSGDVARGLVFGRLTPDAAAALGAVDPVVAAATLQEADAPLVSLAARGAMTLVDPWPVLCSALCEAVPEGARAGLYFDNNHLTNAGAMIVAPLLQQAGQADD